jgi:hypothetical protein
LARLEYSALRINEWNPRTLKYEARPKVFTGERRTYLANALDVLEGGQAHSRIGIEVLHCEYRTDKSSRAVGLFGSLKSAQFAHTPRFQSMRFPSVIAIKVRQAFVPVARPAGLAPDLPLVERALLADNGERVPLASVTLPASSPGKVLTRCRYRGRDAAGPGNDR